MKKKAKADKAAKNFADLVNEASKQQEPTASKIINRAALHRFLRAEFARLDVKGPLPRGGLASLEALLETHATTQARGWALNRRWKASGGRFGQPELPASTAARKQATGPPAAAEPVTVPGSDGSDLEIPTWMRVRGKTPPP